MLLLSLGFVLSKAGTRETSSKLEFSSDHSLDTVVHVLDEVLLGAAETAAVRDVEDTVAGVGVLTVLTTDLDVVLVSDALEARPVLHEVW